MKQRNISATLKQPLYWFLMTLNGFGLGIHSAHAQSISIINSNAGIIVDAQQQLRWQACPIGQSWQENSCAGVRKSLTWTEAQQLNQQLSHLAGWRLPTETELKNFLKFNAGVDSPAPWLVTLPSTDTGQQPNFFWSSSVGNGYQTGVWAVQADSQRSHFYFRQNKGWVLMVQENSAENIQ